MQHAKATCVHVNWATKEARWIKRCSHKRGKDATYFCFNIHNFQECVKLNLDLAISRFGDKTFKQTLGVPMGILCSPLDSRAYFIVRDFKFMLHLISQGRITDARKMNNTFRIADDVVAVNNLRFHQLLDEYMDWNILTLNDETQEHYTNDHGQLIPYGAPMADTYLPSRPQHPHNPLRVL